MDFVPEKRRSAGTKNVIDVPEMATLIGGGNPYNHRRNERSNVPWAFVTSASLLAGTRKNCSVTIRKRTMKLLQAQPYHAVRRFVVLAVGMRRKIQSSPS